MDWSVIQVRARRRRRVLRFELSLRLEYPLNLLRTGGRLASSLRALTPSVALSASPGFAQRNGECHRDICRIDYDSYWSSVDDECQSPCEDNVAIKGFESRCNMLPEVRNTLIPTL
jgi:hypothetical protein